MGIVRHIRVDILKNLILLQTMAQFKPDSSVSYIDSSSRDKNDYRAAKRIKSQHEAPLRFNYRNSVRLVPRKV